MTAASPGPDIRAAIAALEAEIAGACARAARPAGEVAVVAVTKGHPAERARDALAAGLADLGESRAQELAPKARALAAERPGPGEAPRWHFIGHLQRNKVREVVPLISCLHSLDSQRLLRAIEREHGRLRESRGGAASPLPCYLQVNVAGDPAKHGVAPGELEPLLEAALASEAVVVLGLMTVAPEGDPESARPHFRALARLAREHGLTGLSMGMTDDYRVAVEEGATLVRIGRALLGERATGAG
ncbi:MAG: YggS family pyridoxal phosphate-dependent enzyme [Chloroflexi bacterium]|nr:YggS family pyridoxal phosphate-dependent enzyme [Chloroflexota bacterium]